MRPLNPIQTRAEGRSLRPRMVIEPGTHVAAMRRLRARLRENGVVSITVAELARQTMATPFLGGRLRLPTGPLSPARSSGTPLLPVHCVRGDDGGFTVHIAEPLTVGSRQEGDAGFARALDDYLRSLAPHVERHPEQ
jgi:lauroyl/myristoyl acyltransferase